MTSSYMEERCRMSKTDAQKKATAKYNAKAYDQITIRVPKGGKERIASAAEKAGTSTNAYVKAAIENAMGASLGDDEGGAEARGRNPPKPAKSKNTLQDKLASTGNVIQIRPGNSEAGTKAQPQAETLEAEPAASTGTKAQPQAETPKAKFPASIIQKMRELASRLKEKFFNFLYDPFDDRDLFEDFGNDSRNKK
jgi:hypothetical protein